MLFSSERQHSYNRVIIYAIYLLSLLLPIFLLINNNDIQVASSDFKEGIEIEQPIFVGMYNEAAFEIHHSLLLKVILGSYLFGIIIMLNYSIRSFLQIYKIVREGRSVKQAGYTLILSDKENIAPFSWMKYIVMNEHDYKETGEMIIIHEKRHLEYHHWIDLLFAQIVLIFQWFNPAAWLLRDEYKTVHEYQADEAVLSSGANIRDYQRLLIKKAVGSQFHSLANSLNHSKLKKRVTMMYKEKSSLKRRCGALLLLPVMALGCLTVQIPAFAGFLKAESETTLFSHSENKISKNTSKQPKKEVTKPEKMSLNMDETSAVSSAKGPSAVSESVVKATSSAEISEDKSSEVNESRPSNKIYSAVEVCAEPEEGMKNLLTFLRDNINYPEEAVKEGKEGRVIVRFVVDKNGVVANPEIVKGVDPVLDKEALRVVGLMKKWTPATVDGEPVDSYYVLPVAFTLPKEDVK
ncbi:MAG: TonB family protein [Muribaculaceae bacterium]|nr:TonB family protein [Muribaculaceae bacterium]